MGYEYSTSKKGAFGRTDFHSVYVFYFSDLKHFTISAYFDKVPKPTSHDASLGEKVLPKLQCTVGSVEARHATKRTKIQNES
jgi:hypothetical protein